MSSKSQGLQSFRNSVVEVLVETGGLNRPSAENYEKAIYNMSCRKAAKPSKEIYTRIAYDKLGQLVCAKDRVEREKILADIRKDVDEWDACVYSDQLATYTASMDRSVLKPKAIKGLYKCKDKECGSDEFYVWNEQRRSADEGASVMRQCAKCGKRGKE